MRLSSNLFFFLFNTYYCPQCYIFTSVLFICQSSIMPINRCISFVSHAFQVPSFLIHLFSLFSPFHLHALLIFHSCVFPLLPIHLHTLSISLCVMPPSPSSPPSRMLLFSLSAVTLSLAGLGNSVQCALLSCGE